MAAAERLRNAAWEALHLGRLDEAERLFSSAAALDRASGDRAGQAASLNGLAGVRRYQHRFAESKAVADKYLALARTLGDPGELATALGNCAALLREIAVEGGDAPAAVRALELALEQERVATGHDLRGSLQFALGTRALLERDRGRTAEARTLFERQVEVAKRIGRPDEMARALANLATLCLELGDPDDADRWLSEAEALGRTARLDHAVERSIAGIRQVALPVAKGAGASRMAMYERSWEAFSAGDLAQALRLIEGGLALPGAPPVERTLCMGHRGAVLQQMGEHARAVADFEAVLASPAMEPGTVWTTRFARAQSLVKLGRQAEARRELEQLVAGGGVDAGERAQAVFALADLLEGAGEHAGTRYLLQRLLGEPELPLAVRCAAELRIARLLVGMGRSAEAEAHLDGACSTPGGSRDTLCAALVLRGTLRAGVGDEDRALDDFLAATEIPEGTPLNASLARHQAACILAERGDLGRAVELWRGVGPREALPPQIWAGAQRALADALRETGRRAEARAVRSGVSRGRPARGRRDRILTLIALYKLLQAALLAAAGPGALDLLRPGLAARVREWTASLPGDVVPEGAFVLAALFVAEGIGLWRGKRWAEFLVLVETGTLIPFALRALTKTPGIPVLLVLLLNLAVVAFLLHRLRPLRRGGHPRSTRLA